MKILLVIAICLSCSLVHCQSHDRRPVDIVVGDGYYESPHDRPEPSYRPVHQPEPSDHQLNNPHKVQPGYHHGFQPYGYKKGADCGPLPDIKNGRIEIVPDTKKASIAMHFCDEGFYLYGKGQRICDYGKWSGKPPKCIPINCGYLPPISNGRVILSGTGFRDTATYLCKNGFDVVGGRQRKCQENAEWSGTAPMCKKISCPKLSPPSYGKVFVTGRYPADVAYYSCAYGYYLDGEKRRECLRTGEWSGNEPECKKPVPVTKSPPPKTDYSDDDYYY